MNRLDSSQYKSLDRFKNAKIRAKLDEEANKLDEYTVVCDICRDTFQSKLKKNYKCKACN
jgi:tRNA(Ile2) C34 agmatinyltransferase TiaS